MPVWSVIHLRTCELPAAAAAGRQSRLVMPPPPFVLAQPALGIENGNDKTALPRARTRPLAGESALGQGQAPTTDSQPSGIDRLKHFPCQTRPSPVQSKPFGPANGPRKDLPPPLGAQATSKGPAQPGSLHSNRSFLLGLMQTDKNIVRSSRWGAVSLTPNMATYMSAQRPGLLALAC